MFGVDTVVPRGDIRVRCLGRLRKEEKGNAEEYTDRRSGNNPDREEVEENTQRQSTRRAVRCWRSSRQGRQQPFALDVREHTRRRAERIGKVGRLRGTPRSKLGRSAALQRQLIGQCVHWNLSNRLTRHSLRTRPRPGEAR